MKRVLKVKSLTMKQSAVRRLTSFADQYLHSMSTSCGGGIPFVAESGTGLISEKTPARRAIDETIE
jgi:hypothetical protein